MKYFLLPLILILTSCSLDKNSIYWNEDPLKKSEDNKKLSKILQKTSDFKTMTFEEFDIFLKDYSDKADYPDINN
ncbi:hypothetical protein [Candidatus Pelagibacter sp. Uisw_127]|uniref:hypothetical protein n=1 Tax=Candidatus Pelagibacter sp. Uisw_127 TaxID=3230988 RepID=UPI0039E9CBAC